MRYTPFAIFAAMLGITSPSHALINGSFEDSTFGDGTTPTGEVHGIDLTDLNGTEWDVYDDVPGWSTVEGNGIEIQNNTVVSAHSGNRYVELDSHPHGDSNSTMAQTVDTVSGGQYQLEFYFHSRIYSATSNAIGVSFGDESFSVNGLPYQGWRKITHTFTADGASTDLLFSALGREETLGGFIDTVSLTRINVPELDPSGGTSALTLLLGGLAVVLGGRRRRNS